MVLLLGLHGHGGWCEVGSRLSVGHCWAGAGPSENWRPELLELCSVFCVQCSPWCGPGSDPPTSAASAAPRTDLTPPPPPPLELSTNLREVFTTVLGRDFSFWIVSSSDFTIQTLY